MGRVEFKKSLLGRRTVSYDCPRCAARLSSPLEEAGKKDSCPDCGATFTVPGTEELDRVSHDREIAEQRRDVERLLARRKEDLKRQAAEKIEAARLQSAALRDPRVETEKTPPDPPKSSPADADHPVRCPKCGSSQIAANKRGFGLKNAAVGGILLGPLGLLGGVIGGGKIKITCLKCGTVFEPGGG
jgi:DNA-directed RNA polymerase subunit RPC12/RpoP